MVFVKLSINIKERGAPAVLILASVLVSSKLGSCPPEEDAHVDGLNRHLVHDPAHERRRVRYNCGGLIATSGRELEQPAEPVRRRVENDNIGSIEALAFGDLVQRGRGEG